MIEPRPHILVPASSSKAPCCEEWGKSKFLMGLPDLQSGSLGDNAFMICFDHRKVYQIAVGVVTELEQETFSPDNPRFYEVKDTYKDDCTSHDIKPEVNENWVLGDAEACTYEGVGVDSSYDKYLVWRAQKPSSHEFLVVSKEEFYSENYYKKRLSTKTETVVHTVVTDGAIPFSCNLGCGECLDELYEIEHPAPPFVPGPSIEELKEQLRKLEQENAVLKRGLLDE